MDSQPIKISFITSVYRPGPYLEPFLELYREQFGSPAHELMLIHNDPDDTERAVIERYAALIPNLRHICVERESVYASWNRAVKASSGEYLAIWNVDDRRSPHGLREQVLKLDRNPSVVMVSGDYVKVFRYGDSGGLRVRDRLRRSRLMGAPRFRNGCFFMWRRSLHGEIGFFDEQFQVAGDREFWYRTARRFRVDRAGGILGSYLRTKGSGLSRSSSNKELQTRESALISWRYAALVVTSPLTLPALQGYRRAEAVNFGEPVLIDGLARRTALSAVPSIMLFFVPFLINLAVETRFALFSLLRRRRRAGDAGPDNAPENAPDNALDTSPVNASESAPKNVPDNAPKNVPGNALENASDNAPEHHPLKILFSHYAIIDREGFGRSFMLARELAAQGHEVTFLTTQPPERFVFPWYRELREGVRIVALPDLVPGFMRRTGFGALSVLMRLVYVLFRRFDIYHADVGHRPSGGLALLIKKLFRPRMVYVSEWWDHFGRGGQYDDKRGFRRHTHGRFDLITEVPEKRLASGVVCLSNGMKRRAEGLGLRTPLEVVPGGADVPSIPFYPETGLRNRFGMDPDAVCFGFVGMNEGEVRDIEPFLDAFYSLRRQGRNLNWFTTGRILPAAVRERYGVGPELTEFGWVDYADFGALLSCADAFVLMQQENRKNDTRWPNKIGDYLAAGRPVLANMQGEIRALYDAYPDLFLAAAWSAGSVEIAIAQFMDEMTGESAPDIASDALLSEPGPFSGTAVRTTRPPAMQTVRTARPPAVHTVRTARPPAVQTTRPPDVQTAQPPATIKTGIFASMIARREQIRRIAEQHLSWQRRAETLESFYRSLI